MFPFSFHVPTDLRFGAGCFGEAGKLARGLGQHALLVTSRTAMQRLGYTEQLTSDLHQQGIAVTPFKAFRSSPTLLLFGPADGSHFVTPFKAFRSSPTTDDVDRGVELVRRQRVDRVIALGGGSALDCAKAIAGVAPGGGPTSDYLYGRRHVGKEALPIVAIPTTAGTGSELNKSAIVTDVQRRYKDGIRSPDKPGKQEAAARLGVRFVGLPDLFSAADIVSIQIPLSGNARQIVDHRLLDIMKRDAMIVNVARGGIVDEQALYEALCSGRLGGAALDVFAHEPPGDHPLLKLDNFIGTPHVGAQTLEAQQDVGRDVVRIIDAFAAGEALENFGVVV